jgi:acyl carrier protein
MIIETQDSFPGGIEMTVSEIEVEIGKMFSEVLEEPNVDYNENFVDLGGESLQAMLIISRIRRAFEVELSVEDLFLEKSSVSAIARQIELLQSSKF